MSTRDVTLRWEDPNLIEKGHKVYRSKTPMDINDMPVPIASLEKNATEFVDVGQTIGDTNYYRVSSWIDGHELFSNEYSLQVGNCGESTISNISSMELFSVYWKVSKETCFKDSAATIPVENHGDPVLSIKDSSNRNIILKLNQNNGATYIEDTEGDYVQYDPYRDFFVNLPVTIRYPWTMSAWMDNRDWDGVNQNHNYISIANPSSSVDQVMLAGVRNDQNDNRDNPAIATNIGGFISKYYNTDKDRFSMVAIFDHTSSFTIDSSVDVSDTYTRGGPRGSYILSVGSLRRNSHTASDSNGRLKTLFIANYRPSDQEIDDLHKFNKC